MASPKQWQAIIAAKTGPCRACVQPDSNGHGLGVIEFHHLVPRSQGGDDVAENIVPLHSLCHENVTRGYRFAIGAVQETLTDSESAYVVGKLGESGPARLFGVGPVNLPKDDSPALHAASCSKCGRAPLGSYAPNPTTNYLCAYCNETARLRDEGVVVDRFGCVCHEACLEAARA